MRLFFYGVLLEGLGEWPFLKGIGPGRPATTRGRLYALEASDGWHPAMLAGDDVVVGAVHDAGGADIDAMDAFEGAEYRRRPFSVEADGEQLEAHAYAWIEELPGGAIRIEHGDFARWLSETGRQPIAGR